MIMQQTTTSLTLLVKIMGFVPKRLSIFVLALSLTLTLQISAPGPLLISDLDPSLHDKRICPEAYSTSGITFTCSISGRELHWDIHSEVWWRATVFLRSCTIRHDRQNNIIPGLRITGHQPSCNSTETTIKSEVTVTPDPQRITSEKLNVSCFTYSGSEVNPIRAASHTIIKFSLTNSIPGEPQKIENGPTLMCWEAPLDSNPIYYEIEYTTHGSAKCRRETSNHWDLPRATEISNVSIRAVDECGHRGKAKDVTLNLTSRFDHVADPSSNTGKVVSNEKGCNCDAYRISVVVTILMLCTVIFGLVILVALLLIVLYTDPEANKQGGQISRRANIQRNLVQYFGFKAVKLAPA